MDEKVYTPEVIVENPFPGEPTLIDSSSKPSSDGNYSPTVTRPKPFKRKVLANELLSTALNTRSRKILGEFSFAASGALQLGDFREGISGDLRLTPNGITARDLAGLTTFALDGTDGSAVFKGHVQAGSFVSGSDNGVTVGPEIGVNGADFTDIQEAIDFINDLGGGTVFIQAGHFVIDKDIQLYSNINILGADQYTTILDFNNTTYGLRCVGISTDRKSNISIINLKVIGSTSVNYGAIYFQFCDDVIVEKCNFSNNFNPLTENDGFDILCTETNAILVSTCKSEDSGHLFGAFTNCIGSVIFSTINNSVQDAIFINGSARCVIIGNNIYSPGGSGIIASAANGNRIIGNYFEGIVDYAVYISGGSHNTISSNTMLDSADTSSFIFLEDGSRNIVSNNNCFTDNVSGTGIKVENGDRNVISGNITSGFNTNISLDIDSDRNIVTSNMMGGALVDNGTNTSTNNNITT